jgi:hypothetical protein
MEVKIMNNENSGAIDTELLADPNFLKMIQYLEENENLKSFAPEIMKKVAGIDEKSLGLSKEQVEQLKGKIIQSMSDWKENAQESMKSQFTEMMDELKNRIDITKNMYNQFKENIKEGAANFVATIKEKGKAAVQNAFSVFLEKSHIGDMLGKLTSMHQENIKFYDKCLAKIDGMEKGYLESRAGRAIEAVKSRIHNVGRAIAGRDTNGETGKVKIGVFDAMRFPLAKCKADESKSVEFLMRMSRKVEKVKKHLQEAKIEHSLNNIEKVTADTVKKFVPKKAVTGR